jgi:hypothetical protein
MDAGKLPARDAFSAFTASCSGKGGGFVPFRGAAATYFLSLLF